MTEDKNNSKWRWVFIALACLLLLLILGILSRPVVKDLKTASLKAAFAEQNKLFQGPIASLGVVGRPDIHFQCSDTAHTRTQTKTFCQNFASYKYSPLPMATDAKDNFTKNAAQLDELLKQNGWLPDRPQDSIHTLVDSNPYVPANNGQGGEVPFYKNIGSISCNLKIDVAGTAFNGNPGPGSINVNEFSCSQNISYPSFNPTNWVAPPGP